MEKQKIDEILDNAIESHKNGDFEKAETLYQSILEETPSHSYALNYLSLIYKYREDYDKAISLSKLSIEYENSNPMFHNNMGTIYESINKLPEAALCYKQALSLNKNYIDAHYNLANVNYSLGEYYDAIYHYKTVLFYETKHINARFHLANCCRQIGHLVEAEAQFLKILSSHPEHFAAANNLAAIYIDVSLKDKARFWLEHAIQYNNNSAELYNNFANCLDETNELHDILHYQQKALQINPYFEDVLNNHMRQLLRSSNWEKIDELEKKIEDKKLTTTITPFLGLCLYDNGYKNLEITQQWTRKFCNTNLDFDRENILRPRKEKIQLGYVSADFHEHATSYLAKEMFFNHSSEFFDVTLFSYGPDDQSTIREHLASSATKFYDIRNLSFVECAELIYELGIDILIDLKGHTSHNRFQIFTYRPAPIQINFLGYPGTMGIAAYDYIIADNTIIPPEFEKHYTETVLRISPTYQINSSKNIDYYPLTRSDFNLKDDAFVFSCMNQSFKITKELFDAWIVILKQVTNSQLWLLNDNKLATANLYAYAKKNSIEDKIVFAEPLPQKEHLQRLRLADLALDTLIYNGHTTTSDALFSLIPVLTIQGQHFQSRVSSSLLKAIQLEECIVNSLEEYIEYAVKLATDEELYINLCGKITIDTLDEVFDSYGFTQKLDRLYLDISEQGFDRL